MDGLFVWTVVIVATVMIGMAVAAFAMLMLNEKQQSEQGEDGAQDCWLLEMWNIRYGYRISMLFRSNVILGRGTLFGNVEAGTVPEIDATISREQCMLYEQDAILWVWNLSAVNPTMINGYRLNAPRQLLPGDRLEMGNSAFLVTRAEYIR